MTSADQKAGGPAKAKRAPPNYDQDGEAAMIAFLAIENDAPPGFDIWGEEGRVSLNEGSSPHCCFEWRENQQCGPPLEREGRCQQTTSQCVRNDQAKPVHHGMAKHQLVATSRRVSGGPRRTTTGRRGPVGKRGSGRDQDAGTDARRSAIALQQGQRGHTATRAHGPVTDKAAAMEREQARDILAELTQAERDALINQAERELRAE